VGDVDDVAAGEREAEGAIGVAVEDFEELGSAHGGYCTQRKIKADKLDCCVPIADKLNERRVLWDWIPMGSRSVKIGGWKPIYNKEAVPAFDILCGGTEMM